MAAKIKLKKSSVSGNAPGSGDLEYGELAINYADGRLYYKNSSNVIKNFIDSDLLQATLSGVGGTGTVTSVAATVPTGFTVAGSPITSSGTLAVSYAAGYQGYTTTEASKLAGIEAGATGDQTASEILTAIKTVDGAASGLDADLLDGQQGSYYLNYSNFANTPNVLDSADVLAMFSGGTGVTYTAATGTIAIGQDVSTSASPSFAGLTVDSDTLYVNATNNRVGIGTLSPGTPLHVVHSNPVIRLEDDNGSDANIDANGGNLRLYADGWVGLYPANSAAPTLYAGTSGVIGIGTTSPSSGRVHINGTTSGYGLRVNDNVYVGSGTVTTGRQSSTAPLTAQVDGDALIRVASANNGGDAGIQFIGAGDRGSIYGTSGYDIHVEPNAQYGDVDIILKAKNDTTYTTRVGINKTAPSSTLDVAGIITAEDGINIGSSSQVSGNQSLYIYGYDTSAAAAKYGQLRVASDGSFSITAQDTYLLLNAANYIQSSTTHNFTSSILFSGDTNLYRAAANNLKTDDSFSVASNLYINAASNTADPVRISRTSPTSNQVGMSFNVSGVHERWFGVGTDANPYWATSANLTGGSEIWHAGNDGSGSGLDADLLDGQQGSYYAPLASPALTGTPTAPTAAAGTNTTQIATTAFVGTAVSNLVASAPTTLDTLNELAAALGDDPNFATTVTNSIATKLPLAGGTMTGKLTLSTTGYSISDDLHVWKGSYSVNNANPRNLLYSDGNALPNGGAYRFHAHIPATGTDQSATAVYWNQNGTWNVNVTYQSGNSSNHPEFIVGANGLPQISIDHTSFYTVEVLHERIELGEGTGTDNLAGFGADAYLGSVSGVLRYKDPSSTSATDYTTGNLVFHDGYHPNADKLTTARTISLGGDLSGSASFDGSANITITAAVADDSHNHSSSSGNFTVGGDLTVSGDEIIMAGSNNRTKYLVWNSDTYGIGMGATYTFGGLNSYAMTFQMSNNGDRGFWWGDSGHTDAQGAMSLTTNGKLAVAHSIRVGYGETDTTIPGASYALDVNGAFAATTKSFVIDHPTKPGMKLRHGSLEGPEDGVYVRGRLKDSNVIQLPDYWTGLVDEDSITVQLTAIGGNADLWVEDIVDNTVVVGSFRDVNCFYFIQATRKDVEKWDVEYEG